MCYYLLLRYNLLQSVSLGIMSNLQIYHRCTKTFIQHIQVLVSVVYNFFI